MKAFNDNQSPGSGSGDKLKQALDELLGSDDGTDVENHESLQQIYRDKSGSVDSLSQTRDEFPGSDRVTSSGRLRHPRISRGM